MYVNVLHILFIRINTNQHFSHTQKMQRKQSRDIDSQRPREIGGYQIENKQQIKLEKHRYNKYNPLK